jgi:hypothetical protein
MHKVLYGRRSSIRLKRQLLDDDPIDVSHVCYAPTITRNEAFASNISHRGDSKCEVKSW